MCNDVFFYFSVVPHLYWEQPSLSLMCSCEDTEADFAVLCRHVWRQNRCVQMRGGVHQGHEMGTLTLSSEAATIMFLTIQWMQPDMHVLVHTGMWGTYSDRERLTIGTDETFDCMRSSCFDLRKSSPVHVHDNLHAHTHDLMSLFLAKVLKCFQTSPKWCSVSVLHLDLLLRVSVAARLPPAERERGSVLSTRG